MERADDTSPRADTALFARATEVLRGQIAADDAVRAHGDGNGMKALRALDDRLTSPGTRLLFVCTKGEGAVMIAVPALLEATRRCLALDAAAVPSEERASRIAAAYRPRGDVDPELTGACARHVLCDNADPLASVLAIGELELRAGRHAKAREVLERAVMLLESGAARASLGTASFLLARSLETTDRIRATALARAARANLIGAEGDHTSEVAEIERWLVRVRGR